MTPIPIPMTPASGNKNAEMIRVLVPVIVVVILIFVARHFLKGLTDGLSKPFEALNIMDTADEKKEKAAAEKKIKAVEKSESNPFNPDYYKTMQKKYKVMLITSAASKKFVSQIWDAIGMISDSPDEIFAVFKQLSTKTQVSFLAEQFYIAKKKDLLTWLTEKLDTTEQKIVLGKIIDYVNGLKIGKL